MKGTDIMVLCCVFMVRWSRVKTPPFHGGNTGSNPVRTILSGIAQLVVAHDC